MIKCDVGVWIQEWTQEAQELKYKSNLFNRNKNQDQTSNNRTPRLDKAVVAELSSSGRAGTTKTTINKRCWKLQEGVKKKYKQKIGSNAGRLSKVLNRKSLAILGTTESKHQQKIPSAELGE